MNHFKFLSISVSALVALNLSLHPLPAAPVEPPAGFTALFNGTDLTGWRGGDTFDHRKYLEMPADKRAEQAAKWTEDMKKHWRGQDGELINDGNGKYATTEKDYGDFEFLVDYKTVAKADSGIYLRGDRRCRSGITPRRPSLASARTRAAAASEQQPRGARQGPARARGQTVW